MHFQYILRGFRTMGLWGCLFTALLGGILTGCRTTGFYGQTTSRQLNMSTQAFFNQDWPQARKGFKSMAAQTKNPNAMAAGRYGLACIDMATAEDIPSFLKALASFFHEPDSAGMDRFRNQNPELFIFAADHGIRLMEKKLKEQADQLFLLGLKEKRSAKKIRTHEQTIKHLKHQIQVLERIDRELQEKRNPS